LAPYGGGIWPVTIFFVEGNANSRRGQRPDQRFAWQHDRIPPLFGVRPLQWGPYRTRTHSENLVVVGFASSPQPASDVHLLSYRSNGQICQTYQTVRFAQDWHNKREQSST